MFIKNCFGRVYLLSTTNKKDKEYVQILKGKLKDAKKTPIGICSRFNFSLTRPSGPGQSRSRDVHVCIYIYVPSPCNLFQGLSLALRSHDHFKAFNWSTPPPP